MTLWDSFLVGLGLFVSPVAVLIVVIILAGLALGWTFVTWGKYDDHYWWYPPLTSLVALVAVAAIPTLFVFFGTNLVCPISWTEACW